MNDLKIDHYKEKISTTGWYLFKYLHHYLELLWISMVSQLKKQYLVLIQCNPPKSYSGNTPVACIDFPHPESKLLFTDSWILNIQTHFKTAIKRHNVGMPEAVMCEDFALDFARMRRFLDCTLGDDLQCKFLLITRGQETFRKAALK